jgi:sulfatase modifying factor 1
MRKIRFVTAIGALCGMTICAQLHCSPTGGENAGNSTQTGNPVVAGIFYNPDGTTPAFNVAVYIRSINKLSDTNDLGSSFVEPNTAVAYTDANGQYAIDTLDTGMYVIEGTSGNNRVLIDSVHIINSETTTTIPPGTLKPAGAIKGVIYLSAGGDLRKVFVLAYGIDRFEQVNSDGAFIFKGLAEGSFDLRIITLNNDYNVMDTFDIPVKSADTTDLDTLKLSHVDIPPPTNLQVRYDTLHQIVQLRWSPADTSRIDGYTVYRAVKGRDGSRQILMFLPKTATVFADTSVNVGLTYEYRVVSRISSGEESHKIDSEADTVMAVSSSLVTTTFSWIAGTTSGDTASIGDTVAIILSCANPTRRIDSVYWYDGSGSAPVRVLKDSLCTVIDTLRIVWFSSGVRQIFVHVVDGAKTGWADTTQIHVIQDTPRVTIKGDTSVYNNVPATFYAETFQRFGTIMEYEWKFGAGPWIATTVPEVQITTPVFGQVYVCSLRVTDDDGNITIDVMNIRVWEHQGPMVKITAAGQTFQSGEAGLDDPVRQVTISYDFWMDTTEVEQAEFQSLMGFNPSHFGNVSKGPVEGVTWFDAVLFCNARSNRDRMDSLYAFSAKTMVGESCTGLTDLVINYSGNGYRLPTEAEWEYACRSGTTGSYYWGSSDDDSTMGLYAWFYSNSGSTTHAVAGRRANDFGLYDMSGNVEEWCNDWFGDYGTDAMLDPTGPISGSYRILRGGSWDRGAHYLRSASRAYVAPSPQVANDGFRLCRRAL